MRITINLVLLGFLLLLSACVEKQFIEDTLENLNTQEQGFSCSMQFDASYPHYNGENETRATVSGEWKDGDVIYLFLGGENEAYANATYDKEHNNWKLYSDRMLEACGTAECSVWYGKGSGERVLTEETIVYDYLTEAYYTESGQYSFQDGEIRVSAELKPFAKRLRFKGVPGTTFEVNGKGKLLQYNAISYNGSIGFKLRAERVWTLEVKEDGYTDYHVFCSDASTSKITILDLQTYSPYSRYFDKNTLKEGESGCYSYPVAWSMNGWSLENYVDLGLPSGTKWATCNIGADSPIEFGNYFAWGETESKDYYEWNTYKWCDGAWYKMNKYCSNDNKLSLDIEDDAAYVLCGDQWKTPSIEEYEELKRYCSISNIRLNDDSGYLGCKITGSNGNSIFIPAAGYMCGISVYEKWLGCFCWSSSNNSNNSDAYAVYFRLISSRNDVVRAYGLPIRPVLR